MGEASPSELQFSKVKSSMEASSKDPVAQKDDSGTHRASNRSPMLIEQSLVPTSLGMTPSAQASQKKMMSEDDVGLGTGQNSVHDPSTIVNTEVPVSVKDASNTS